MYIKYKDFNGFWNIIENPIDFSWKYSYKTEKELTELFDTEPEVMEIELAEGPNEPPANGYRILEMNWADKNDCLAEGFTNLPCFLINDSGKTIENLTP